MSDLDALLNDAEAFAKSQGLSVATISRKLFGDGTRIRKMREKKAGVTFARMEKARKTLTELQQASQGEAA